MAEEEKLASHDEKPLSNGAWLMKTLKPLGCIIVLVTMVLMIVLCFTVGRDPIKGYEPPQSSEYYATHQVELLAELEANVFPHVDGVISGELSGDAVKISIEAVSFAKTRSAILRYYNIELFEFSEIE